MSDEESHAVRPAPEASIFQTPTRSISTLQSSKSSLDHHSTTERKSVYFQNEDREYRKLSVEAEEVRSQEAAAVLRLRELEAGLAQRERTIASFERKLTEIWRKARSPRDSASHVANELTAARRQVDELDLRIEKARRQADEARIAAETAEAHQKAAALREKQLQDRIHALETETKAMTVLPEIQPQAIPSNTILEARRLAEENDRLRFALASAQHKSQRAHIRADFYQSLADDTAAAADSAVKEACSSVATLRDALLRKEEAAPSPLLISAPENYHQYDQEISNR